LRLGNKQRTPHDLAGSDSKPDYDSVVADGTEREPHNYHHHHPHTTVHGGRTTADVYGRASVRGQPMGRGRGVLSGRRGVRVASSHSIRAPRGHAGGHRSGHAAAVVGRLSDGGRNRDGTRTAA